MKDDYSSDILFTTAKNSLKKARKALLDSNNSVINDVGNIKTTADLIAQDVIVGEFKKNNISCKIFSEETISPIILGDGEIDIIIDPLDNSYLFLKGIKEFCSSAMIILEKNVVRYAFVQELLVDDLYFCDSNSAYLNDTKLSVEYKEPLLISAYGARVNRFEYITKLQRLSSNFFYLNTGGPLLAAMVGANKISATIEFKPVGFYEMAGSIIAQKAGAILETIEGHPIVFEPEARQTIITSSSQELLEQIQNCMS